MGDVKVTMLMYAGLPPDVQERLEWLDAKVFDALTKAGIDSRCVWTAQAGTAYLLQGGTREPVYSVPVKDIAGMTDDALIGDIWHKAQK